MPRDKSMTPAAIWPPNIAAPEGIHRLVSAGVEDVLERFSDPSLLDSGKGNLVSLEAVKNGFGARWELRRDQVYAFTARVLQRGVDADGFFVRISPTDFFVVHPELSGGAAHAACLRYLREVLNHFLGEDDMAVVGQQLRVRGLDGLRVIDASMMPTLISGNTQATSIMIGEKGAHLILHGESSRLVER